MYKFVDFLSNYVESKEYSFILFLICTVLFQMSSLSLHGYFRHFDCSILMLSYQTFMPVCLSPEENFYFFFFTIARID